jgi:ribosomal protein S6--L-glutamate ligase
MRIAVLGSAKSWYFRDLRRAASGRHAIVPVAFEELTSEVLHGRQAMSYRETDLMAFDAILVRTMPPGSLEQVVFRMDVLGRLEAQGALIINPPRAIEAAVDKYLAIAKLAAAGLRVPRTITCQSVSDAMQAYQSLGGSVVLKPLFGSEGRGITRINDEALMLRAAKMLTSMGAVLYVQQYIEHHGCDLRLLVLGSEVLGIRRCNSHDWRTNVSRGASVERLEVTGDLGELAQRASTAVGTLVAGVDVLPGKDGHLYTLEVNAVPGWQAVVRGLQVDVAARLLAYVETLALQNGTTRTQAATREEDWKRSDP